MKLLTNTISIAIFALIVFVGCGQDKSITVPDRWQTINDSFYVISYPDSLEVDTSGIGGVNLILKTPAGDSTDMLRENIGLQIQNLAGMNITLDSFVILSENQLKEHIPNCQIEESFSVTDDGKPYHAIVYTGNMGIIAYRWMQRYYVYEEKAYIVSFTSEQRAYEKYRPLALAIFDTFDAKK
jgi:hypothetical protein